MDEERIGKFLLIECLLSVGFLLTFWFTKGFGLGAIFDTKALFIMYMSIEAFVIILMRHHMEHSLLKGTVGVNGK